MRPTAAASQVDVSVKFLLTGALAQFSRSGLVKDVADHLTRVFAQNLEARLSGKPLASESARTLDAGAVARSAIFGAHPELSSAGSWAASDPCRFAATMLRIEASTREALRWKNPERPLLIFAQPRSRCLTTETRHDRQQAL